MSSWIRQADVGRCDFIDVLEEAAVRRSSVELETASGERLSDRVADVESVPGDDVVVLKGGRRLPVGEIAAMTRAR